MPGPVKRHVKKDQPPLPPTAPCHYCTSARTNWAAAWNMWLCYNCRLTRTDCLLKHKMTDEEEIDKYIRSRFLMW